jgi:RNA polymerase sigma-70 factor (ECF subfamily)
MPLSRVVVNIFLDEELVTKVLAGDRNAYSILVGKYQALLYRQALGMLGDQDAASDLVQDAFIKAYTSLARCQDPSRFGAWVFRILTNRCKDYLKDRRRHTVPLQPETAAVPERENPDTVLAQQQLQKRVVAALATLPDNQREAFLLKHVEGLSYEEMAALLDASVSALKMRVLRAREALQSLLAGEL